MPHPLLIVLFCVFFSCAVLASTPHEHGHQQQSDKLVLNDGQKWPTDAPLRDAMATLRHSLMAVLDDIHHHRLNDQGYVKLAEEVQQQSHQIISQCALEPQADAQFHIILAQLLKSAQSMQQPEQQRQGAILLLNALQNYQIYFEDPDFAPVVH